MTINLWLLKITDRKPIKLARRVNGQVARKIPVTINGQLVEYIYR